MSNAMTFLLPENRLAISVGVRRLNATRTDHDVRHAPETGWTAIMRRRSQQSTHVLPTQAVVTGIPIEDVATLIRQQSDPQSDLNVHIQSPSHLGAIDLPSEAAQKGRLSIADVLNTSPSLTKAQVSANANIFTPVPTAHTSHLTQEAKRMSFSAHKILQWPAIQALLPDFLQGLDLVEDYVTKLEAARPPLPFDVPMTSGYGTARGPGKHDWLHSLPLSVIRGLTEAYFNTFNTSNPILDRGYFYTATLSVAMESGFGYNIESCILLIVLALGCMAVTAHKEAGFPLFPLRGEGADGMVGFVPPDWVEVTEEAEGMPSGLRFLNEQRRRIGFLMCGMGLEYVQCHLLVGLYYAQAVRVLDHWNMIHKAAVGCLMLLNGSKAELMDWDAWESDMLARVFWNTLMFESILVQELDVPPSGLTDYEEIVPLPKFPSYASPSSLASSSVEDTESNYQYHFLAQAAHRKLLNRMRNSVYSYGKPILPRTTRSNGFSNRNRVRHDTVPVHSSVPRAPAPTRPLAFPPPAIHPTGSSKLTFAVITHKTRLTCHDGNATRSLSRWQTPHASAVCV
ncbi:hypothetical protein TWF788_008771 [Orbilia oligospora]|uniref:Xylanolytic transcriptional activator regulatory domain-containing protein n=2 Tax=Orbilia oligospora TaxID=2813651 RepID=A0A7C8PM98_ORBOL|nr:hypothetical protein TWF788_008771 [Orbilia oligospora]